MTTYARCDGTPVSSRPARGASAFPRSAASVKTDQVHRGHWIDIAASDTTDSAFDGFSAVAELLVAHDLLLYGPIYRRVWRRGSSWSLAPVFFEHDHTNAELADYPRNRLYADFAREFHNALVAHYGVSSAEAVAFSTRAIRRGSGDFAGQGLGAGPHHYGPGGRRLVGVGPHI